MKVEDICDALKTLAATINGVKVVALGINNALPETPVVEVVPLGFSLQTLAAGNLDQEEDGAVAMAVYVALTQNLESDERTLLPIVDDLVAALRSPAFDRTLGGLVEDVRPTRVDFDVVRRNGRNYRSAVVHVAVGDLASPI